MKILNKTHLTPLLLAVLLGGAAALAATATVNLGAADNFAVVGGSTVTNTGSTVITGDLGLFPGTSVTGFPPGTVAGTQHIADTQANSAQTSATNAYTDAAGRTPATTLPTELGGTTRVPGVYDSATGTFGITGTLTLDAGGDPNAVFIFKADSTLITAGASNVVLAGGAQACNVFWQVGSSATLGANSTFKGSILAAASITLTTGAAVEGRVLARSGAVTLDSNAVTRPICVVAPVPTPPPAPVATSTPTPVVTATTTAIVTTATTTVVVTPVFTPVMTTVVTPTLPNTGIGPDDTLAP